MFTERTLAGDLAAIHDEYAPDTLVLDCQLDFETLDPAVAEELGLLVDALDPVSYPTEWLPSDAPAVLERYASDEFTIGMPGDGGIAWTHQTTPPVVFVKPRVAGSPDSFVEFLIAAALVEVGRAVPEHFLAFFEERYRELASAVPLDPVGTYQLAGALSTGAIGRQTREVFAAWDDEHPDLHAAWMDAGARLEPRLGDISREVARGETAFPAAAELACGALRHDVALPAPFAALDSVAYDDHGAEYAVEWTRKTFEKLDE